MNTLRLALLVSLLPFPVEAAPAKSVKLLITPASKTSIVFNAPWAALRSPRTLIASDLKLPPQLRLPFAAAVQAVSSVKQPPAITSLSNLSKIQDGPLRALSFSLWDGGKDLHGEEEYAHHEQKKHEEKKELHMDRSVVDYRPSALYDAAADEFLARAFDMGTGRAWTGRELLALLLTPHAIVDGLAPDFSRVDVSLFGKSDGELREILDGHGIVPTLFHEMLGEAFNSGLIYRLNVSALGKTYYGVPYSARRGLQTAAPEAPKKEDPRDASAFAASLLKLAADVEARAAGDELLEFTVQAVRSAIAEGVMKEGDAPAGLRAKMDEAASDGESLARALLTALESAYGTGLFEQAQAACREAVAAGLLAEAELEKVLAEL